MSNSTKSSFIKLIDTSTYQSRISTCKSCEYLFKLTNTCKKCGCFMSVKAKLTTSNCPMNKW